MAVVWAGSCSSNLTLNLGTSVCCKGSCRKNKKKECELPMQATYIDFVVVIVLVFCLCFAFCLFCFLRLKVWQMEIPRLGVEPELQPLVGSETCLQPTLQLTVTPDP